MVCHIFSDELWEWCASGSTGPIGMQIPHFNTWLRLYVQQIDANDYVNHYVKTNLPIILIIYQSVVYV